MSQIVIFLAPGLCRLFARAKMLYRLVDEWLKFSSFYILAFFVVNCSSRQQINKYYSPPIAKSKPNIVFGSDPKTQRKLCKPQNVANKNFCIIVLN